MTTAAHEPVMVQEVVQFLGGRSTVVDMTVGLGGHAEALLASGVGRLVGVDRDPEALAIATERLASFGDRFSSQRLPFSQVKVDGPVDGILYDLGVSSLQLDDPQRGFSYRSPGPLDMRMGPDARRVVEIVNDLPEDELADLIYEYGEERRSRRVAAAIVRARSRAPIETTDELARVVASAVGSNAGGPPPRASDVPGAPHRGQPGARGARRLPASGGRPPRSRRPRRRDRLPLARGPHREVVAARRRAPAHPDEEALRASPEEVQRNPRSRSACFAPPNAIDRVARREHSARKLARPAPSRAPRPSLVPGPKASSHGPPTSRRPAAVPRAARRRLRHRGCAATSDS